ncbi:rod shape-determining protein RodA [bacterium]|nr:rod shape-determining protein RodA [bacterium]
MLKIKNFDTGLFMAWFILVSLGIVTIYTASITTYGEFYHVNNYYVKQFIFFMAIIPIFYLVLKIPFFIIDALIIPGYIISIILLVIVLFTPEINGSNRWIQIGTFRLQPSEIAKITTILIVSKFLAKPHQGDLRKIFIGFALVITPIFLIMIEPDFGTTLVFWVTIFAMLLAADVPIIYLLILLAPIISISLVILSPFSSLFFILLFSFVMFKLKFHWVIQAVSFIANIFASLVFWQILKPYQINRILTFIDPTRDPLGAGYQVIQSKIAIGSGGLWGKGFLHGTQKNLDFLPEHHTDFIFSVYGEELGFLLSLVLFSLFFFLLIKIIKSIDKIYVLERKIATVGIFSFLFFQMFVNIGMNIGIVPTTGVPLPFISYGGSNLVINSISIALIQKYIVEKGFMK